MLEYIEYRIEYFLFPKLIKGRHNDTHSFFPEWAIFTQAMICSAVIILSMMHSVILFP